MMWRRWIEPLPGCPPDWQQRRMTVFERASGGCERCGLPAESIAPRNAHGV